MYNYKTIIRFSFCDILNYQSLGKCYHTLAFGLADNTYLKLDYSRYHENLIQ